MNNEKKIEIPAMPEKYRLMLGMLPEEPAGSKEEQSVRWKLRSAILDAYSAGAQQTPAAGHDAGAHVAQRARHADQPLVGDRAKAR